MKLLALSSENASATAHRRDRATGTVDPFRKHDDLRTCRDKAGLDRSARKGDVRNVAFSCLREDGPDPRILRPAANHVDRAVLQRDRLRNRQQHSIAEPNDAELVGKDSRTAQAQRRGQRALARTGLGDEQHRRAAKFHDTRVQQQVLVEHVREAPVDAPLEQGQRRVARKRLEWFDSVGDEARLRSDQAPDSAGLHHLQVRVAEPRFDLPRELRIDLLQVRRQSRDRRSYPNAHRAQIEHQTVSGQRVFDLRGRRRTERRTGRGLIHPPACAPGEAPATPTCEGFPAVCAGPAARPRRSRPVRPARRRAMVRVRERPTGSCRESSRSARRRRPRRRGCAS